MKKTNKKAYEFGKNAKNVDVFYLDLRGYDSTTAMQMIMDYCDALAAKYGHYHVIAQGYDGEQLHLVK